MDSTKEERALALAEAEEAFNTIAKGSDRIVASKFPELWRSLNGSYCKEEHRVTLKKITEGEDVKVISRQAFLKWYHWYIFEPLDSYFSEEESDD